MWIAITIVGIFALIVVIGVRLAARPADDAHDGPGDQPTVDSGAEEYPTPGSGESPHRPDGSPLPGSQEYRHEHGRE